MSDESFLTRTGQFKVLAIGCVSMVFGFIMTFAPVTGLVAGQDALAQMAIVMGGVFLTFAAFVFLCIRIKCPSCRGRVFWQAFSQRRLGNSAFDALSSAGCPCCGFVPASRHE